MHEERSSVGGIGKTVGRDGNEAAHTQDGSEPINALKMPASDSPKTTQESVVHKNRWGEDTDVERAEELLADILDKASNGALSRILNGEVLNWGEQCSVVGAVLGWAYDAEQILGKSVFPYLDTQLYFLWMDVYSKLLENKYPPEMSNMEMLINMFELAASIPESTTLGHMNLVATILLPMLPSDLKYTYLSALARQAEEHFRRYIDHGTMNTIGGPWNHEAQDLFMWSKLCALEGAPDLRFASLGLQGLQGYDKARAQLGLSGVGALSGGQKVLYRRLLEQAGSAEVAGLLFNAVLKDAGLIPS